MKSTFEVTGMTCQGCVNAVTRAVTRAAPGAKVAVDLGQGKVSVEGQADETTVRQAITDAGYEVKGAVAA